jgi:hypothetical protein
MEAVEVHPRFIEEPVEQAEPQQQPDLPAAPSVTQPSAAVLFLSRYKIHIVVFLIVILIIILGYLIFWYEPTPVVPIRAPPNPPIMQHRPPPADSRQQEPDYESVLSDIQKAQKQPEEAQPESPRIDSVNNNTNNSNVSNNVSNGISSSNDNITDVTIDIPDDKESVEDYMHDVDTPAYVPEDSTVVEMNLMDTHVDEKKKKRCSMVLANGQQCKKMSYNNTCNLHHST